MPLCVHCVLYSVCSPDACVRVPDARALPQATLVSSAGTAVPWRKRIAAHLKHYAYHQGS